LFIRNLVGHRAGCQANREVFSKRLHAAQYTLGKHVSVSLVRCVHSLLLGIVVHAGSLVLIQVKLASETRPVLSLILVLEVEIVVCAEETLSGPLAKILIKQLQTICIVEGNITAALADLRLRKEVHAYLLGRAHRGVVVRLERKVLVVEEVALGPLLCGNALWRDIAFLGDNTLRYEVRIDRGNGSLEPRAGAGQAGEPFR